MITVSECQHPPFGTCVLLTNGVIELMVSVEAGPRLLHVSFCGQSNVLYEDPTDQHVFLNKTLTQFTGQPAYHHLYGGHRLYLSPAHLPQARYPDNAPVVYTPQPTGALFTAPVQKNTGIQLSMQLLLNEATPDFMVIHTAQNQADQPQSAALCTTTMVKGGGFAVLPQNQGSAFFVPDRVYTYWPFTRVQDPRFVMHPAFMTIQHNAALPYSFKMGYNNTSGLLAYANNGTVLTKRYLHDPAALYPDHDSSSQIYCNKHFLELTVQSPLYRITAGETVKHVENFALYRTNVTKPPTTEPDYQSFLNALI